MIDVACQLVHRSRPDENSDTVVQERCLPIGVGDKGFAAQRSIHENNIAVVIIALDQLLLQQELREIGVAGVGYIIHFS